MTDASPAEFVLALGALLPLAALIVSSFLGAYVLGLSPRRSANRSAFLVMVAFIIWDLGEIVQRSFAPGTSSDALFFWARVTWIGIVLVPAPLYHLALTYPSRSPWFRGPWALAIIYAPFVFWAYLVTSTNLIISGMSANAFGPSARIAPTYAYFAPFFGVWMFSSVLVFVRSWWRVRKTPSRSMQSVVVLGLILGTVPAAVTELAWPVLTGTDTRLGLGSLDTMMWSIFIASSAARDRDLHIEPAVEVRPARAPRPRLERGLNYLVPANGRSAAMGGFGDVHARPGRGPPRSRGSTG